MLERPDELFRGMLLELFELRYGGSVDRPVHALRKKELTPEARRRARGRDYGAASSATPPGSRLGDMNVRQATAGKGR